MLRQSVACSQWPACVRTKYRITVPPMTVSTYRHLSSSSARRLAAAGIPTLPSDKFQLLPEREKAGKEEDSLFDAQVQDVQKWWASPRYQGIKRPYSAEDVVTKRGTLQQVYPSSLMAGKLFSLLKEREAAGEPVHTSALMIDQKLSTIGADFSASSTQWVPLIPCR